MTDRSPSADPMRLSRRGLMLGLGPAALVSVTTGARAAVPRAPAPAGTIPPDPNGKFDANGAVVPWPGDTVVSPLPSCSPAFRAMLQVNVEVARLFHAFVATTPPGSYHMTIFGGADPERRRHEWWPAGIPVGTPIASVDRQLRDRVSRMTFAYPVPIRMVVDTGEDLPDAPAIFLKPASAEDRDALHGLRHQLSHCLGITPPDVDTFRFHVTFGYIYRQMPADVAALFRGRLRAWRMAVGATAPIAFPAPAFCSFQDMFAFDPLQELPRAAPSSPALGIDRGRPT